MGTRLDERVEAQIYLKHNQMLSALQFQINYKCQADKQIPQMSPGFFPVRRQILV